MHNTTAAKASWGGGLTRVLAVWGWCGAVTEDVYKNAVAAFKKMAGSTTKEMSRRRFTKTLSQKYPEDFANLIFDTFDTDGNGAMSVCTPLARTRHTWLPSCCCCGSLGVSAWLGRAAVRVSCVHGPVERRVGGAEAAGLVHAVRQGPQRRAGKGRGDHVLPDAAALVDVQVLCRIARRKEAQERRSVQGADG